MKRIIFLGVFISVCIVLMVNATSAVEYRAVIEDNTNEINSNSEKLTDFKTTILNAPQPTCIRLILHFIIGLIFSIIGTILGMLFGPILVLIIKIITAPAILLAKIITFIINLITFLIPNQNNLFAN